MQLQQTALRERPSAIRTRLLNPLAGRRVPIPAARFLPPLADTNATSRAAREEAFNDFFAETRAGQQGLFQKILAATCRYFNEPRARILSHVRTAELSYARHVVMYLACWHTSLSSPQIGRLMNRDYSTVLYGKQKIKDQLAGGKHDRLIADVRAIERALGLT